MHSGGLTRFARGLLSIPSCCRDNIPAPLEGLQYIWAQRCFSTSATPSTPPSTPTTSAAPADNAATSQQNQPDTKDAARLEYEDEMRKLRRKWQGQHAQKLAIKAKAEATKTANKAVTIEGHRRKKAEMKELRMQIHEERRRLQSAELAQRQALAAKFRAATQGIYAELQTQRRQELLEESRDWITPETLDARIQDALEHPVELFQQASQQDWNYKN